MKPENILESSTLDILFENKNKAYGAYELRRFYPNRLKKSIGATALLVLIFAVLQGWKTPKKVVNLYVGKVITLAKFDNPTPEKPKPIEKKPIQREVKKAVAEVIYTNPTITPDHLVKNIVPDVTDVDTSFIGSKFNLIGGQDSGFVGITPGLSNDTSNYKTIVSTTNNDDDSTTFNPTESPEFQGGIEALQNFMLRNLHQPNDIAEGERIVVLAQFVVDKKGNISDVEIIQNGRDDLDNEVLRVIQKMPKWKPGLQNGLPLSVYFKMPISFVNNN